MIYLSRDDNIKTPIALIDFSPQSEGGIGVVDPREGFV